MQNITEEFIDSHIIWDNLEDAFIIYDIDGFELSTASSWKEAVAKFKKYLKDTNANIQELS